MRDSDRTGGSTVGMLDDKERRRRLVLSRLSPDLRAAFSAEREPLPEDFQRLLDQID